MTCPPPSSSRSERKPRLPGTTRRAALALMGGLAAGREMPASARGESPGLVGWIAVEMRGAEVRFVAMAAARAAVEVSYTLRVVRAGAGGRTSSAQGGRASLVGGGEARTLSTVGVSIAAGASFAASLTVTGPDGGAVETTISHPPAFGL